MSGPSIDFEGINAAVLRDGRSFVQDLIPGGKFRSLEYIVRNPTRDDQHAGSFSINYKTGVWKDFATGDGGADLISLFASVRGCNQGDAAREMADKFGVPFLKANGSAAPRPLNGGSTTEASQIYHWGDNGPPQRDEMRRHTYRRDGIAVRIKIKRSGGGFVNWYRVFLDSRPIGWQAKKPEGFQAVPYVTATLNPFDPELRNDRLFWPEGEKDVETLNKLNLPAFTFGGTGDGLPSNIDHYLKDRHIVILADNDDGGRQHAEKKAAYAQNAGAASVRIVHFPELPPKKDISDFIERGGTIERLNERVDRAPIWRPSSSTDAHEAKTEPTSLVIRIASDIQAQPITWLWPNRIAIGKQTLIAGDPGVGKSQLTCCLAAAVTTGGDWPCGEGQAPQGSVVVFSAEDDAADTIVPRLLAAGADLDRVRIVEAVTTDDGKGNKSRRMFHLQADLARLETTLSEIGDVRLVIIDPITAYLGGVDTHRNSDVRGVLGLVAEMAARHHVAVVVISHWNKSGVGSAVNRVTGSGAFTAAVRAAFMVAKDPEDDGRRLFIPMKNNLARTDGGLAFRLEQRIVGKDQVIVGSAVSWDNERVTRTADEVLAATGIAGIHSTALDEATDWLQELLASGPMAAKDIQTQADAAGLSWATIRRAKDRLGIKPVRQSEGGDGNGKWLWALPADRLQGAQKTQDAHVPDVSTLRAFEQLGGQENAS
jgi:putative DNA primase/helicase